MQRDKVPEKDIRQHLLDAIPRFQVPQAQALQGMDEQATTSLKPLPPVSNTFRKINPGESWEAYKKARGY
jgi:hypothetical protein